MQKWNYSIASRTGSGHTDVQGNPEGQYPATSDKKLKKQLVACLMSIKIQRLYQGIE